MQHVVGEEDLGHAMALDTVRRLSGGERVIVAGSAIVALSLLLPWWDNGFDTTANGFHDWGWLTFLSLLLVAALFSLRNLVPAQRRPELSVSDPVAYMIGGGAELVGAVVFWLTNNSRLIGGVKYGVFIAVVGGAVTVAGGYIKHLETQTGAAAPQPPAQ
jgi:hypothetical protein